MKWDIEDQDTIEVYPSFLLRNGNSIKTYVAVKMKWRKALVKSYETMVLDFFLEFWHWWQEKEYISPVG